MIEAVWSFIKSISLADAGSIASILGLLFTGFVLWGLVRIRKEFVTKARLPELTDSLKSNAKNLSEALRSFDESKREVQTILSVCKSTLKNLIDKLSGNVRKDARNLLRMIDRQDSSSDKDKAWKIYNELQALIESLKHYQQDRKWSQ